jgi:hypothetical protein
MMEASSFSETMVPIYCPKQCHIFLTPSIIWTASHSALRIYVWARPL